MAAVLQTRVFMAAVLQTHVFMVEVLQTHVSQTFSHDGFLQFFSNSADTLRKIWQVVSPSDSTRGNI
jgi:hypothetical protein